MALKNIVKGVIRDLAEIRLDNGAPAAAMRMVRGGCDAEGNAVLDESGSVILRPEESVLGRADFKRLGLVVLYAPAVTSANRKVLLDVDQMIDLTVTDQRVVIVYDDLSTKSHWGGEGLGAVLAIGMNVAHAVGSKIRHHGEAAVFEVEIAQLNRVLAPSVPTLSWANERSLMFGWQEDRNLGVGDMRIVLLDQRDDTEHLGIGRLLIAHRVGRPTVTSDVNWLKPKLGA